MDVLILSGSSILLFISSIMIRDLSGQTDRRGKKQIISFGSVAIGSAVIICTAFPWEHWWQGVAWAVGLFLFGRLAHYLAT
jgi:VIT1/CCC1 family predicted Fe2+/Mn2+ transporter